MNLRINILIFLVLLVGLLLPAPTASFAAPGQGPAGVGRVVLDPGHGGQDPGVQGPGGLTESRLCLALARRLKVALEDNLGAVVFLTRTEDRDLEPAQRAGAANRLRADLFLSLHAGGSLSPSRAGFQVFYHDHRLQAGLAERPGASSAEQPAASSAERDRPEISLWSLAQARFTPSSRELALDLAGALSEVLHVKSREVTGLPLAVLAGAARPAVLVEVGYLTNPEEERRLSSQAYRDALTRALVRGIQAWHERLRRRFSE